MSETKPHRQIGYKIEKIHTVKFLYQDLEESQVNEIFKTPEGLGVNLKDTMSINPAKTTLTIDIVSSLIDKSKSKRIIEHIGRTSFEILDLKQFQMDEENTFSFPNPLLIELYNLAISHARALLAIELSSTPFKDKFILPVVDPMDLIPRKR